MSPTGITDLGPGEDGIDPYPTQANNQHNTAITAANEAKNLNATLLIFYMNDWNSWAALVIGGYAHTAQPPQPPMAWAPIVNPADGCSYVGIGTVPVCALPPTPPGPPPIVVPVDGTISVGHRDAGDPTGPWFTVGYGDTIAPGKTVIATSADGVYGDFRKFGSPFGGWYELIQQL